MKPPSVSIPTPPVRLTPGSQRPLSLTTALSRSEERTDGVPRGRETTFTQTMAHEPCTLCVTTVPPCLCGALLRSVHGPSRSLRSGPPTPASLVLLPVPSGYGRSSMNIPVQMGHSVQVTQQMRETGRRLAGGHTQLQKDGSGRFLELQACAGGSLLPPAARFRPSL